VSTAEQPQVPSPGSDQAVPLYQKVLTPLMLRWLALTSFALAVGILLYWSFYPSKLDNAMSRFVASLLVATLFAVFFFVFYPDQLEMNVPGVLGTTLRLTGPIVLFIFVFWLVRTYMPTPSAGRLFEVWKNGERGGVYLGDSSTTYLKGREGDTPPDHMLVGFPDGRRRLYGVYVLFPANVSSVKVYLHHEGWDEELPLELDRDGKAIIDVTNVKEVLNTP
jgi:hypothetical protein